MTKTREDILAMPVGRELDALVAEKVMGYEILETRYKVNGYTAYLADFKPSTDISASWEVVERMKERGFGFVLIDSPNGKKSKVTADFANGSTRIIESAHTPQEAICKAALLAVTE